MWQENYILASDARSFMHKVYGWMSTALFITAMVAYYIAITPSFYIPLFKSPMLLFAIIAAQIGTVMYLSFRIQSMTYESAIFTFLLYAALTGITISSVFLVYTHSSIALTFGITAAMFLTMSLYGYFTKADLSSLGSILFMGLIGIIIASIANMFIQSSMLDYYMSLFAVGIFTLLTAYDTQKIKQLAHTFSSEPSLRPKIAIIGALTLYLDFINLFLYLIRLLGKRKD